MKRFYRITWGEGFAQIVPTKLETTIIMFDLLKNYKTVQIDTIDVHINKKPAIKNNQNKFDFKTQN